MTDSTFHRPSVSELRAEAAGIVNRTPPRDLLLAALTLPFHVLGWIVGRAWWCGAEMLVLCFVAGKYGYWNGARVPAEQRVSKQAPQPPRQQ